MPCSLTWDHLKDGDKQEVRIHWLPERVKEEERQEVPRCVLGGDHAVVREAGARVPLLIVNVDATEAAGLLLDLRGLIPILRKWLCEWEQRLAEKFLFAVHRRVLW